MGPCVSDLLVHGNGWRFMGEAPGVLRGDAMAAVRGDLAVTGDGGFPAVRGKSREWVACRSRSTLMM